MVLSIGRRFANPGKAGNEQGRARPVIAELWNAIPTLYAQHGILQSVASSYATAGMASRHSEKMESSFYMQSIGHGCINDGVRTIIIIMTVKNKCPVDFSPQIRCMNIFPHEKKLDIGVLPRVEASSRFRHHAQTYRFPNRSLVRKTRQGFRYHKKSKNKSRIYILMFRTANIYMRFKNKSWIDILWFLDVCFGCPNRFATL